MTVTAHTITAEALAALLQGVLQTDREAAAAALETLAGCLRRSAPAPVPMPMPPRVPAPGAPWSKDDMRGDASRWPPVWETWLPRWQESAAAHGVTHRHDAWGGDEFNGSRDSLITLGIVGPGDFPGDTGRGVCMVTFACDGMPKRKGENGCPAIQVHKRGRRFGVEVRPPEAVRMARREALIEARRELDTPARAAPPIPRRRAVPAWLEVLPGGQS